MSYPCEIHSQFELREQVENDAPLVIQDAQVLLFVVLRIRHLLTGADVFQPWVLLWKQEGKENWPRWTACTKSNILIIFFLHLLCRNHTYFHILRTQKKCNKLRSQSKANTKRWCTFGTLVMLSIPQSQTQWCSLWHLSSEKAKRRKIKSFSSPTIQLSIPMIRSRISFRGQDRTC